MVIVLIVVVVFAFFVHSVIVNALKGPSQRAGGNPNAPGSYRGPVDSFNQYPPPPPMHYQSSLPPPPPPPPKPQVVYLTDSDPTPPWGIPRE